MKRSLNQNSDEVDISYYDGEQEGATLWEMEERQLHERGTSLPRPKRTYSSCSGTKWMMERGRKIEPGS